MSTLRKSQSIISLGIISLLLVSSVLLSQPLQAQHGHPLVGTWSGFMERDDGPQMRVLLMMSFSKEQVITGNLIVNGRPFPLTSASLDHENWSVNLTGEGRDRSGFALKYEIQADIGNLDSPTERTLVGTWREDGRSGDFQVVIN